MVDADAFIDLSDLIGEHAPNLKKIYGEYFGRLKWSKDDKGIYILPTAAVNQTYFEPGTGLLKN